MKRPRILAVAAIGLVLLGASARAAPPTAASSSGTCLGEHRSTLHSSSGTRAHGYFGELQRRWVATQRDEGTNYGSYLNGWMGDCPR